MARLPARVSWIIHHRTGVKVALRLSKAKMTFQAEYGGQTYTSKDGAEVKKQILDAIEESHRLTFQPVIEVEVARKSYGSIYYERANFGAGLAIGISRFHFSQEGTLRKLSWDDHERNNITRLKKWCPSGWKGYAENFTLPFSRPNQLSYGNDSYYLPYTEETWEGLQHIVTLIEAAKQHLDSFLQDQDIVAKLILIGTGMPYPLLQTREEDP